MDRIKTQIIKIAEFLFEYKNLEVTIAQDNRRYWALVSRTDTDNDNIKDIENGWGYSEETAVENLFKRLCNTMATTLRKAEQEIEYLENEKSRLYKMVEHIKTLTEEIEKPQ